MKLQKSEVSTRSRPATPQDILLGMACSLYSDSDAHQKHAMAHLRRVFIPAMRHQQIEMFFDDEGKPVGCVIWAMLAQDVEMRVLTKKSWILHESEWNEGNSVWIVDMVAKPGYLIGITRHLRNTTFKDLHQIRYMRNRLGKRRFMELARSPSRHGFQMGLAQLEDHSTRSVQATHCE